MTYEKMKQQLDDYNWDDGFEFPEQILSSSNCDLALALEIFYLADGYSYLVSMEKNVCSLDKWLSFIKKLYVDIKEGIYTKSNHGFEIPLSKVQCYCLRKQNIPEVFLTNI